MLQIFCLKAPQLCLILEDLQFTEIEETEAVVSKGRLKFCSRLWVKQWLEQWLEQSQDRSYLRHCFVSVCFENTKIYSGTLILLNF